MSHRFSWIDFVRSASYWSFFDTVSWRLDTSSLRRAASSSRSRCISPSFDWTASLLCWSSELLKPSSWIFCLADLISETCERIFYSYSLISFWLPSRLLTFWIHLFCDSTLAYSYFSMSCLYFCVSLSKSELCTDCIFSISFCSADFSSSHLFTACLSSSICYWALCAWSSQFYFKVAKDCRLDWRVLFNSWLSANRILHSSTSTCWLARDYPAVASSRCFSETSACSLWISESRSFTPSSYSSRALFSSAAAHSVFWFSAWFCSAYDLTSASSCAIRWDYPSIFLFSSEFFYSICALLLSPSSMLDRRF